MRISDWSSDVCSSDLRDHRCHLPFPALFSELIIQNADHAGTSLAQISILLLTIAVPRLSFDRDRRLAFSNIAMSVARSTAGRPFRAIGHHALPRTLHSPRHRCGHLGHDPDNIPGPNGRAECRGQAW